MKPYILGILCMLAAGPAASQCGGPGDPCYGSSSDGSTKIGQAGTDPIGVALFPIASMHDMKGKRWSFSIAPGIWKIDNISYDSHPSLTPAGAYPASDTFPAAIKGSVLGLALRREVSAKWGYGMLVGVARQSGSMDFGAYTNNFVTSAAQTQTPGGAGAVGGEISDVGGEAIAFLFTYDPFPDPDGFRMPVSLGLFTATQRFKFSHSYTNANNGAAQEESVDFKRTFTGPVLNLSFDFLVFKKLRIMPGILFATTPDGGGNETYEYEVKQNGAVVSRSEKGLDDAKKEFGAVYLDLHYRPWNLSLSQKLDPFGDNYMTATTLSWTKRWG